MVGTITYDTGVNAGFHPDGTGTSINRIVGNRFNSALGGPLLMTGMVTMLTAFPANSGNQYISVGAAPTPANTIMILDYFLANLMAGSFNSVAVTPAVTVTSDFTAMFMGAFAATQAAGLLGMSDMETMGQGFHAWQADYQSAMVANNAAAVPNRNAMLRATGDVLVPVELMDFKIQ